MSLQEQKEPAQEHHDIYESYSTGVTQEAESSSTQDAVTPSVQYSVEDRTGYFSDREKLKILRNLIADLGQTHAIDRSFDSWKMQVSRCVVEFFDPVPQDLVIPWKLCPTEETLNSLQDEIENGSAHRLDRNRLSPFWISIVHDAERVLPWYSNPEYRILKPRYDHCVDMVKQIWAQQPKEVRDECIESYQLTDELHDTMGVYADKAEKIWKALEATYLSLNVEYLQTKKRITNIALGHPPTRYDYLEKVQ